jgi:hypothetical protein
MNNEILVTIGMPIYNSEKFLYQAISSVLNQTYPYFEFILTDDGSTDRSVSIVESFNDSRIILLKDNENKGISYRLNQQIQLAKGTYFARMDADDIMLPNRIEQQVHFMIENPQTDVVGTAVCIIDDNNKILGYRKASHKKTQAEALQGAVFVHPSVLGKTNWFKQYPYKEEFIGMEDYELWIRTIEKSYFAYIDDILLFYRDPLKFKLKTYLFRQQQLRKFFLDTTINYQLNERVRIKELIKSYFKSITAYCFSLLGMDNLIIKRRNIAFENIKEQNILKNMLNVYEKNNLA